MALKSKIYGRITASPPGKVWGVGDFSEFGSPDAITKALQRLATSGFLRRIDRGLYDRPRVNKLTGKSSAPDYRSVIDAVARRDQARMLVDGMTAANDLGLSDAVPGRVVIHSDARLKPIRLDNLQIAFRLTSSRKLVWASRPAMRIVQALHWLKPKLVSQDDRERISRRLLTILSDQKHGVEIRDDLERGFSSLPAWMQAFLRNLLPQQTSIPKRSRRKLPSKTAKAARS